MNEIKLSVLTVEEKYKYDPAETVYGGGDGIVTWGLNNDVPKLLSNCYDKSATLKAAIDQSINYVLGDGVEIHPDAGVWLTQVNRRGQTMKDILDHITFDYYIYGNFAIQVIYNKMGNPVELYALDVSKCRLSQDKNKVYYSSKTWTKYQTKADVYDRVGYADKIDPEKRTQIYFYNGTGIRTVYNKSPWNAALDDVLTEVEGSRYSLNSVVNGFSARYIINIPDTANLTDEQKKGIEDSIKNKFCGTDTTSNFMVYFSNDEDKYIEVRKIEANEDPEHFQVIRNGARENIFVSLRISPLLCGLSSLANTGFSTQEFSDSFKLFDLTVAEPVRHIMENAIEKVTGIKNCIRIKPFQITFDNQESK